MRTQIGWIVSIFVLVTVPAPSLAADSRDQINAYYQCGMREYRPGSGAFVDEENEVSGATFLITNYCSKEYEALKKFLLKRETEMQKFEKALPKNLRPSTPQTTFSASETLRGHFDYLRNQVQFLMRLDRFVSCWTFKAGEYVRGTKESAETILDASNLACAKSREKLRDITAAVYPGETDAQFERAIQVARQRVTKYVLDERMKRQAK